MADARDNWKSSLGFVLAAAGSAVGLGNLWKFPYITWENGGGSFVLVYLLCILLVGIPVMIAEIAIGRTAQLSTVPAFAHHTRGRRGGRLWVAAGWMGVATGGVILGYYAVIAGWSISSFARCLSWSINGYTPPEPVAFQQFVSNGPLQVGLAFLFSVATAAIVARGISGGIERATRVLMPSLFCIMLLLAINALTLDGIGDTFAFMFRLGPLSGHGALEALGHAFFTLSLGMGAMITYGSYMNRRESILKAVGAIAGLDTLIALMACVVMYAILFTFPEVKEAMASPVAMLFITIPQLFYSQIPGGTVLAPVFFVLVGFAALTSTISMLEVVVSLLVDKLGVSRRRATVSAAAGIFLLTTACALSNGAVGFFTRFNPFGGAEEGIAGRLNHVILHGTSGVQHVLDHVVSNWCLPVGGLLITLFAGWWLDQDALRTELRLDGARGQWLFRGLQLLLRWVVPFLICLVIYNVNTAD